MEEIWKTIPGYEGLYEASSEGRIRSLDRLSKEFNNHGTMCRILIKGRIMKPSLDQDGYYQIQLTDSNGRPKYYGVHRIIALTFISNDAPENNTQVDHINCDKTDNRVCNLEWVSCKENISRAWHKGRCTPRIPDKESIKRFTILGKKSTAWRGKPCRCVEENRYFFCLKDATSYYNISLDVLRHWITHGRKIGDFRCNGYHFEYISKDTPEYQALLEEFNAKIDTN